MYLGQTKGTQWAVRQENDRKLGGVMYLRGEQMELERGRMWRVEMAKMPCTKNERMKIK